MGTCLRKGIVVLRKHSFAILVENCTENVKLCFFGHLKGRKDGTE